MDDNRRYEAFVRNRITELREQKGVSEHRMSLELGKSGSYIRSITNGISMPSLRELFNIMEYFDLTPTLFFAPMDDPDSLRGIIICAVSLCTRTGQGFSIHIRKTPSNLSFSKSSGVFFCT